MPLKLTTTVNKIQSVPNYANSVITNEFYEYMRSNGSSEHHQNNNLKVAIAFAKFLGPDVTFYDVKKKEQIITFLDTKIKVRSRIPIGDGLLHGIITSIALNSFSGGSITKEERN